MNIIDSKLLCNEVLPRLEITHANWPWRVTRRLAITYTCLGCHGHVMPTFVVQKTKLRNTSKQHSCESWSMYGIWYILINEQQKEWVLLNAERLSMEFGPICIGKRIMICLHTFKDDDFVL